MEVPQTKRHPVPPDPNEREQLFKALHRGRPRGKLFFHEVKHVIDAEVEGIQIETSEGMDCLESEIGFSIGYDERFHALLDSLITYGLDRLLPVAARTNCTLGSQ